MCGFDHPGLMAQLSREDIPDGEVIGQITIRRCNEWEKKATDYGQRIEEWMGGYPSHNTQRPTAPGYVLGVNNYGVSVEMTYPQSWCIGFLINMVASTEAMLRRELRATAAICGTQCVDPESQNAAALYLDLLRRLRSMAEECWSAADLADADESDH